MSSRCQWYAKYSKFDYSVVIVLHVEHPRVLVEGGVRRQHRDGVVRYVADRCMQSVINWVQFN